jgi:sec-independent protein translocase protein TatA
MFGYNITTLVIILVIALLLFGPKRLPELGDSIGKAIKGFKKATEGEPEPLPPSGPGGDLKTSGPGNETAASAKVCPECQKNLGGDFAFCPHCGKKA